MEYIYRYRPLKIAKKDNGHKFYYLLDELRKHYFYLTNSSKENDINEGRPTFFLKGSKYLWMGIFRYFYYYIGIHFMKLQPYEVPPMKRAPTNKQYMKLLDPSTFLEKDTIISLMNKLTNKKVSLSKLRILFFSILDIVIKCINESTIRKYHIKDLNIKYTNNYIDNSHLIYKSLQLILSPKHKENAKTIFDQALAKASKNIKSKLKIYLSIINKFFDSLTKLPLPSASIISFCDSGNNDAMWGNYANKYKGICLKYKVSSDNKLKISRNNYDKLYKVNYSNIFNQYNLFDCLSPNIKNIKSLFKEAYLHHDLTYGTNTRHNLKDIQIDAFSTKDKTWSNENEYRAILFNTNTHEQKYNFNTLKAVILGSRIKEPFKSKIIKILQKQCNLDSTIKTFHIYEMQRTDNLSDLVSKKPIPFLQYDNTLQKFINWYPTNN